MRRQAIVILILLFAFGICVKANQNIIKNKKVTAQLLSAKDSIEIPFAHVILKSSKKGLISNENGIFSVDAPENDTILITAVGFENKEVLVSEQAEAFARIKIYLSPLIYSINEVIIFPYQNYKDFKEAVANLELPEEPDVDLNLPKLYGGSYRITEEGQVMYSAGSPITAIYNLFSKDAKELREYNKLVERKIIENKIEKKYNKDIVKHITGLTDDREVYEFMEFCNFSDEFLLNSNDYKIYLAINERFKEYQELVSPI